jgi:hypothetical protein
VWGRRHSPLQLAQTNNARKRITVYANLSCGTLLIRISKLIKVMLHLHIFLKIKSLYAFYSLPIFLKTCEHLLIGNALYLSNWMTFITYQGYIWSYMTKTFHICLLLCVEFYHVLWPLSRDVLCSQNQNSRTPTNKMLTLALRVTQKHVFSVHQK